MVEDVKDYAAVEKLRYAHHKQRLYFVVNNPNTEKFYSLLDSSGTTIAVCIKVNKEFKEKIKYGYNRYRKERINTINL